MVGHQGSPRTDFTGGGTSTPHPTCLLDDWERRVEGTLRLGISGDPFTPGPGSGGKEVE